MRIDLWRHPLDVVADQHGFPPEMRAAAWAAYAGLKWTAPQRGYADVSALCDLPVLRFLATSGFRRLQASKLRALGLAPLFSAIYIDAIDEPDRKGKEAIFADLLGRYQLRPDEVLVVGDDPDSGIDAGAGHANRAKTPPAQFSIGGGPHPGGACHRRGHKPCVLGYAGGSEVGKRPG